jgi:hypothetical protein
MPPFGVPADAAGYREDFLRIQAFCHNSETKKIEGAREFEEARSVRPNMRLSSENWAGI